jgi:hypothetical protein
MSEAGVYYMGPDGETQPLVLPKPQGAVARSWWPFLDVNDLCRYCVRPYGDCICEEAGEQ